MRIATLLLTGLFAVTAAHAAGDSKINWQKWDTALFQQTEQSPRPVLLNLEAVWCHWCHVMDAKTYADPEIAAYLAAHFITVKVDHDARPDLAGRYRDYGWPATIIYSPQGKELALRAGYIPPQRMLKLLQDIVADADSVAQIVRDQPVTYSESPLLSDSVRTALLRRHKLRYDPVHGGLDISKKFLDEETVEYTMLLAARGDAVEQRRARQTLDAALALIDPEFGGAYQYSTHGDWQHPHYEKIMSTQAGYIRLYTLAYSRFGDARYLQAAEAIADYLLAFLHSPDGAFYTSQDADLIPGVHSDDYFVLDATARRDRGIPRVDTHHYGAENGMAIEALALLSQHSNKPGYLPAALQAARWVVANRTLPDGGFSHDKNNSGGPFLKDSLHMALAGLELYRATANRQWLALATDTARFAGNTFRQQDAGFLSGAPIKGPIGPVPDIIENIQLARLNNLLSHLTGDNYFKRNAEHAMRYLATSSVALSRINESGILLAASELANDPVHFTIVGRKADAAATDLYRVALIQPGWYRRVEWWDRSEGPMPNPDVGYPKMEKSAAYVCTNSRCSLPAFDPVTFRSLIEKLSGT